MPISTASKAPQDTKGVGVGVRGNTEARVLWKGLE